MNSKWYRTDRLIFNTYYYYQTRKKIQLFFLTCYNSGSTSRVNEITKVNREIESWNGNKSEQIAYQISVPASRKPPGCFALFFNSTVVENWINISPSYLVTLSARYPGCLVSDAKAPLPIHLPLCCYFHDHIHWLCGKNQFCEAGIIVLIQRTQTSVLVCGLFTASSQSTRHYWTNVRSILVAASDLWPFVKWSR